MKLTVKKSIAKNLNFELFYDERLRRKRLLIK